MPPAAAKRRMAEIEAALPGARFAWNGRVDGSHTIYYRIPGPNLIIEFSTEDRSAPRVGVRTRKVTDAGRWVWPTTARRARRTQKTPPRPLSG